MTLCLVCPYCLQCLRDSPWSEGMDVEWLFHCDPAWGGCGGHSIIDVPDDLLCCMPHLHEVYVTGEPITAEKAAQYEEMTD